LRSTEYGGRSFPRTEVCLLGGYGFQGVTLGMDRSCKDGKMGSGCCKFGTMVGKQEEVLRVNFFACIQKTLRK
jgi:hypothetical protein